MTDTPTIPEIIAGSYKEGFELAYEIYEPSLVVEIELDSMGRKWRTLQFNGIECRIERDLQTYHGESWKVRWI